jgi:peroxiredoxin
MKLAVWALAALSSAAQTAPLAVGDRIPAFELTAHDGVARTFDSIKGRAGAFLLFHRSADW